MTGLALLLILPLVAAPQPMLETPATQIIFTQPVPMGQEIKAVFVLKNSGQSDLEILRVTPGCGCMIPFFDAIIPPGDKGKLELKVDTGGMRGRIVKRAIIKTNDPKRPTVVFEVVLDVRPDGN
jgi:hypothetical protein